MVVGARKCNLLWMIWRRLKIVVVFLIIIFKLQFIHPAQRHICSRISMTALFYNKWNMSHEVVIFSPAFLFYNNVVALHKMDIYIHICIIITNVSRDDVGMIKCGTWPAAGMFMWAGRWIGQHRPCVNA